MDFRDFMFRVLDLMNKSNGNINVKLTPQKGYIIDILVSVYDDVIIDTSINIHSFPETEEGKMNKIIRAISEYC